MHDELFIEARRADVRRELNKIYATREALEIINAGRPTPVRNGLFSLLFGTRVPAQVEYLDPVAVRVRND